MSQVTQAHCNRCGHSTKHDILAIEEREDDDDGGYTCETYEMLNCRGCGSVKLRYTDQYNEMVHVVYYPPAIARREPGWVRDDIISDLTGNEPRVPTHVCQLMREIYNALQSDSRRLVAMGIRAVLESVMIDKVGDKKRFKANMDAFEAAGYLSVRQRGHLDTILEAGHATIHRGWEPTKADIVTLLDIAESLIQVAYLHDQPADTLSRQIPPSKKCHDKTAGYCRRQSPTLFAEETEGSHNRGATHRCLSEAAQACP